ncbi:RNA polymerase sporulation-specific sigma factor [Lactobacillus colini]|uniref:RNA polymerase sporulation-specific sigma factor n=1 Tax=Lactobacillus colini TaxID=1819254 RepID=A0ABS4MGM5_9LACO|nr:sigma-70 family RNA polymerase sigma factor [Lactobacillus colini]MBP2058853.1 RNA polymerase sporulation-specific sigma factor [Lactobacillus colini]
MDNLELIQLVKQGDSDALLELARRYAGVIYNVKNRYYIRGYDEEDWRQDALLICYQACCSFDVKKGKFGAFLKSYLTNHACTLLRHELAKLREPYRRSVSYEKLLSSGSVDEEFIMPMSINQAILDEYLNSLSHVEIATFIDCISNFKSYSIQAGFTRKQLQQAKHRCRRKFLDLVS